MQALPVETVVEAHADCTDATRARAVLEEALAGSRAPRRDPRSTPAGGAHWTLTMRVGRHPFAGAPAKAADASILDDKGQVVAQRTISDRSARTCVTFARAVGAWAMLVLDAEMNRARDDDGTPATEGAPAAGADRAARDPSRVGAGDGGVSVVALRAGPGAAPGSAPGLGAAGAAGRDAPAAWPRGADAPPRDGDGIDEHGHEQPPKRSVEVGGAVYLRSGLVDGGVGGLSPFVTIEVEPGWLLRPSLAFGRARTATLAHVGGRVDLCRRIPGNYLDRRGMQLDVCAGGDLGGVRPDAPGGDAAFALRSSFGPAATLRGELGGGLAIELRGLGGINLVGEPLVTAAAELGLSMRFR